MYTILCVDSDTYLTDLLAYALRREGYTIQVAHSAAEALSMAKIEPPDAVLLDVMLPDGNGYELCTWFRKSYRIPIVILTACHTDQDIIAGFDHGADDYIAKPFSMKVLIYRLRAILRRTQSISITNDIREETYYLGDAIFTTSDNEVRRDDVRIRLTSVEAKILRLLLAHKGMVLSADQIMERLWAYNADSSITVVKTHIYNLRTKIAAVLGHSELIRTIRGIGYTIPLTPPMPESIHHLTLVGQVGSR